MQNYLFIFKYARILYNIRGLEVYGEDSCIKEKEHPFIGYPL